MSHNTNAKLRSTLEELARLGSPVDLSVATSEVKPPRVEIQQVGSVCFSEIIELEDGRLGLMCEIAITNLTSRTIDLIEVCLGNAAPRRPDGVETVPSPSSADDNVFELLTPLPIPRGEGQRKTLKAGKLLSYSFPGAEMRFGYEDVINHHLVGEHKLPSKRRLEGRLLAIGRPDRLHHGQWYTVPLTLVAADYSEYSATLQLVAHKRPARPLAKERTRIFADVKNQQPLDTTPPAGREPPHASKH